MDLRKLKVPFSSFETTKMNFEIAQSLFRNVCFMQDLKKNKIIKSIILEISRS